MEPVVTQPEEKVVKGRSVWIVGGVFITVIFILALVIFAIGRVYKGGLSRVSDTLPPPDYETIKKKKVRKITIRRNGELGCMEVTPDGIVRIYKECGGELDTANRPVNPKQILKLFQLVARQKFDRSKPEGEVYELIIETDEGTEIVYISVDDGSEDIQEIIETIEDIEEDLPDITPTPLATTPSPSATLPSGSTPWPTSSPGGSSPSPSPGNGSADTPFTCDFVEQGENKPFNVSNIICSEEPQPG